MKIYILILAILPIIFYVCLVYFKDKYEKEPILKLLKYFLFGVLVSFIAILLERYFSSLNIFYGVANKLYTSFFIAGFIEEGLKYIFLIVILLKDKDFNEKLDGIIYSIFISLGFATIENIVYLIRESTKSSFIIAIIRGIICIPSHIVFAIVMGYYISEYKFYKKRDIRNINLVYAFIFPILFHGVFDFILMIQYRWAIIVFIAYVVLLWKISLDKIDKYALYSKMRFYKKR